MDPDILAFIIIVSLIFLVGFGLAILPSYADQINYVGFQITTNPYICIAEPLNVTRFYDVILPATIEGLRDWEIKLNEATDGKWNMTYSIIEQKHQAVTTFTNYPGCNTFILYSEEIRHDF